MKCTTRIDLQDSSIGRASDLGSKGPEFYSRMGHFKILIIFSICLVLYVFDMKSFKLIRNINYILFAFSIIDVIVLRLALCHLYTVLCGVEDRALDCETQHSGFESPQNFIFNLCC